MINKKCPELLKKLKMSKYQVLLKQLQQCYQEIES